MGSGSSSGATFLMFLLVMQLVTTIALLLGGLYLLYCFQRAAAGLDRLASVAEMWLEQQAHRENQTSISAPNAATHSFEQPIAGQPIAAPTEFPSEVRP